MSATCVYAFSASSHLRRVNQYSPMRNCTSST